MTPLEVQWEAEEDEPERSKLKNAIVEQNNIIIHLHV